MSTEKIRAAIEQFVDRAYAALEQTDYYRVLGMSSAASEQEIRDAYYKLAARLHPDIHGEGLDPDFRRKLTTVFSRVVEAYRVLSDPVRPAGGEGGRPARAQVLSPGPAGDGQRRRAVGGDESAHRALDRAGQPDPAGGAGPRRGDAGGTPHVKGRTLTVKCPTWDHVEAFYARKVSAEGGLSARLPFHPRPGDVITIALELPDQLVIAIDAQVEQATPAPDGVKSAVRLRLGGLTGSLRSRLEALVTEARGGPAPDVDSHRSMFDTRPSPGGAKAGSEEELPPPLPIDAPVDEPIAQAVLPAAGEVPAEVRPLFEELERELHRARTSAAHEVLGVRWDAPATDIRRAYFELTKRLHPDVLARHRSRAIDLIAGDVFIAVNRAYDRMRAAAVASGEAIAAGPDLLPHRGWVAGFEDIGTMVGIRDLRAPGEASLTALESPVPAPSGDRPGEAGAPADAGPRNQGGQGSRSRPRPESESGGSQTGRSAGDGPPPRRSAEALAEARQLIAEGEWERAREILAESLRHEPRNRKARALFHFASAQALLESAKTVDARTQLEVALAHDPELEDARAGLDRLRQQEAPARPSLLGRLFK
jgi:curved DNA-binding protein CbpA